MGLRDRYIRPKLVFRDATLTVLLREIGRRGGFGACWLATADGLLVASVPIDLDAETAAAMVALVGETVERVRVRMALPGVDEVSVLFRNSTGLVCRFFEVGDEGFILAVLLPAGREYRALMDEAIRRVLEVWAMSASPDLAAPVTAQPAGLYS
jgi:predicted regulator of Ras-like GTPase activity (Roadblock/LC7/MglB family)